MILLSDNESKKCIDSQIKKIFEYLECTPYILMLLWKKLSYLGVSNTKNKCIIINVKDIYDDAVKRSKNEEDIKSLKYFFCENFIQTLIHECRHLKDSHAEEDEIEEYQVNEWNRLISDPEFMNSLNEIVLISDSGFEEFIPEKN